jgi:O-antigen/teichoic acid export membrane protein
MAYKGLGVWALVAQNLIIAAIPSLVFWFYVKWRPKMVFSWRSFKELFSFGFYMFLSHLVNSFSTQLTGLIIGKVYNASTLGYYSKALGTEKLASHSVSSIMTQVTYPLYAEVQDDRSALINMIKRLTMTISYLTFPMMFILILISKPLFILLYSEKWIQSIPYFQVLCIAGLAACLQSVNAQTISAIGKSRTMFIWTFIKRIIGFTAMVGGLMLFGMKGLLVGVIINAWFAYFVNTSLVSKHIGYKQLQQYLDIAPVAAASVIIAGITYFGVGLLNFNLYVDGIVKLIVFIALYLGWSFVFKPDAYTYFLTIIPARLRFWERIHKKQ